MPSMNDGGASNTKEGQAGWRQQYLQYFNQCNGAMQTICVLGPLTAGGMASHIRDFPVIYSVHGYQGSIGKAEMKWRLDGNTVRSNMIGPAGADNAETLRLVRGAMQKSKPGEPVFLIVRLGLGTNSQFNTRRGILQAAMAHQIMEALKKDPTINRQLHFVPPRDLAATWKAWHQSQPDK